MRLFVAPERLAAGALEVRGEEHHYLMRVRRARIGDAVELVDGAGRRAAARIAAIASEVTTLEVEPPIAVAPPVSHVRCVLPLIKGERMDYALEKLVEVGADSLLLYGAARAVVRLEPAKREARLAKYRAALQAAARQCGRAALPALDHVGDLASAIAALPPGGARFMLDASSSAPLGPVDATDITLVSGPEGGLAPDEQVRLAAAGFVPVSVGSYVLRAETAPVVAVARLR